MKLEAYREWRASPLTQVFFRTLAEYQQGRQVALSEWALSSSKECHSPEWQHSLIRESAKLEMIEWLIELDNIDLIQFEEEEENEPEPSEY